MARAHLQCFRFPLGRRPIDELRAALADYQAAGGSVAVVGPPTLDIATVAIENAEGAAALARALHGRGCRHPAVLAGPEGHVTARLRTEAFLAAFAELGDPVDAGAVLPCAFTHEGGERCGPSSPPAPRSTWCSP